MRFISILLFRKAHFIAQYGCGGCAPKTHVTWKYKLSSAGTLPSLCWYSARNRRNSLQYHVRYGETPQTCWPLSSAFSVQSRRTPAYQSRLSCCCASTQTPQARSVSVRLVSVTPYTTSA